MTTEEFYKRDVRRWHACSVPELRECGDTIQTHQLRCVTLVGLVVPMLTHTLLTAVRWHDQAKVALKHPKYAGMSEAEIAKEFAVPQPASDTERDIVKLTSRLDAYMTAVKYAPPDVLRDEEWMLLLDEVVDRATSLGMLGRVMDILTDQKKAA